MASLRSWALLALCVLAMPARAGADTLADFYRGKQMSIVVGYGPGGGYDLYARLLSRHIGRHMPGNPSVIVQNMPGAGSLRAANFLYNTAPRDGTVFGIFARNMPLMGLMGNNPAVQFDARRFNWLGSSSSFSDDAYLLFAREGAKVHTIEDARKNGGEPLILGSTGEGSPGNDVPILLRETLGLNLKVISGFPDGGAIFLAADRGEVDGRFVDYSSVLAARPIWLKPESGMKVLLQFGRKTRHPKFADVPTARELALSPRATKLIELAEVPYNLSRCFAAPPDVPADRVAALRMAFLETHRDPQFLEDAARMKLDISPSTGEDILEQINIVADAPPELLKELQALAKRKGG